MSEFILVTLRWYHGGILDLSRGESLYIGGKITEFLDVNVDKISIVKLRNYHKLLGYTESHSDIFDIQIDRDFLKFSENFGNGDIIEVYVCHMDLRINGLTALSKSNISNEKYVVAFNEKRSECVEECENVVQKEDEDVHFNGTTKIIAFVEPIIAKTISATQSTVAETAADAQPPTTEIETKKCDKLSRKKDCPLKNFVESRKRDCPLKNFVESSKAAKTSTAIVRSSEGYERPKKLVGTSEIFSKPKGTPRKATIIFEVVGAPSRTRGRPRKTITISKVVETTTRGRGRPRKLTSTFETPHKAKRKSEKAITTSKIVKASTRGRGRSRKLIGTSETLPIAKERPRNIATTSEVVEVPARKRGRPKKLTDTIETPPRARGRPRKKTTTLEVVEAHAKSK